MITEIVALRHDITRLATIVDTLSKERERMYQQLLKAYVALSMSKSGGTAVKTNPYDNLGMFDEVPMGDETGWKSEELELGDAYEEANQ